MRKIFIIGFILIFGVVGIVVFSDNKPTIDLAEAAGENTATVYKSPACGCCDLYTAYLRKFNITVNVENREDMDSIKNKYDIPSSILSCHTTVIDNNIIEGHVPVEAILSMLKDDTVSKIALPNMPSGSPGMPGFKKNPFNIYSFENKQVKEFIKI